MAEELEVSRIGVLFGDEVEGDGKSHLKVSVVLSKEEADSQVSNLKSLTGGALDYDLSVVASFKATNPEKLKEFFQGIFGENGPLVNLAGVQAQFKSVVVGDKVWISVKPPAEIEGSLPLDFLAQAGFDAIAQTQRNSVELSLASNREPIDVCESIKKGDSPISALLDSGKMEAKISVNKNLPESLKNAISSIDPGFGSSPVMFFLQYFKTLDIDLRFGSTQELPDEYRKYLLLKKVPLGESQNPMVQELIELVDGEVEVYGNVPNLASVKITGRAHQISSLIHAAAEFYKNN